MKFLGIITLVLVLELTACQDQDPNEFLQIPATDFQADSQLQNHANFGAQYMIQQGIAAEDFANATYNIARIYSIYEQQNGGQSNYTFDVSLSSAKGGIIRAVYTVTYRQSTQTRSVASYAYDTTSSLNNLVIGAQASSPARLSSGGPSLSKVPFVENPPNITWSGKPWAGEDELHDAQGDPIVGGYTRLSLADFNSQSDVQSLFIFGLENVLGQVVPKGLASQQFTLTNIFRITQQVVAGMNYDFDVQVDNKNGVTVRLSFVVFSQVWTGIQEILSYSYTIRNAATGAVISGNSP